MNYLRRLVEAGARTAAAAAPPAMPPALLGRPAFDGQADPPADDVVAPAPSDLPDGKPEPERRTTANEPAAATRSAEAPTSVPREAPEAPTSRAPWPQQLEIAGASVVRIPRAVAKPVTARVSNARDHDVAATRQSPPAHAPASSVVTLPPQPAAYEPPTIVRPPLAPRAAPSLQLDARVPTAAAPRSKPADGPAVRTPAAHVAVAPAAVPRPLVAAPPRREEAPALSIGRLDVVVHNDAPAPAPVREAASARTLRSPLAPVLDRFRLRP